MSKAFPQLRIGTRGWQFDAWQGEFFPDDLPDEWRFSFYSNEYKSVVVPAEYIDQYSIDDWVDWADDTHDEFGFYIEISPQQQWQKIIEHIDPVTSQLQGFVLLIESNDELGLIEQVLLNAKTIAPVCVSKKPGSTVDEDKFKSFMESHQLNAVWCGEEDQPSWQHHGCAVIYRNDNDDNSPLVIREILEKAGNFAGGHQQIGLFFTGASPKIDDIRNAQMIGELLG